MNDIFLKLKSMFRMQGYLRCYHVFTLCKTNHHYELFIYSTWKSDLRFTWIVVDERRYSSRWRVRLIVAAVVVVFALDLAAPTLLAVLSFLEAVAFVVNSFQHSSAKLLFYFLLVAGLAERKSIFLFYHSQMLFVKIIWKKSNIFWTLQLAVSWWLPKSWSCSLLGSWSWWTAPRKCPDGVVWMPSRSPEKQYTILRGRNNSILN